MTTSTPPPLASIGPKRRETMIAPNIPDPMCINTGAVPQ